MKKKTTENEWTASDGFPTKDGHYMGQETGNGFNIIGGKVELSPGNLRAFQELYDNELAVQALLAAVNQDCQHRLKSIKTHQRQWWDRILTDIGVNRDSHVCSINMANWKISVEPKPKGEPQT